MLFQLFSQFTVSCLFQGFDGPFTNTHFLRNPGILLSVKHSVYNRPHPWRKSIHSFTDQ